MGEVRVSRGLSFSISDVVREGQSWEGNPTAVDMSTISILRDEVVNAMVELLECLSCNRLRLGDESITIVQKKLKI
jgi:hypothetical protein